MDRLTLLLLWQLFFEAYRNLSAAGGYETPPPVTASPTNFHTPTDAHNSHPTTLKKPAHLNQQSVNARSPFD